jgi:GMP synthase (glutamine-hydrolysing) B subunit
VRSRDWTTEDYIERSIEGIRSTVGKSRVILGLSGGVDSSVAAALIHRAIGRRLTCVFVDNGLLRKGEREAVVSLYERNFKIDLRVVDASALFLKRLKSVKDPERKRKIIGKTFVEVFEKSLRQVGAAKFLAQGTLYPDVIESVAIAGNPAALIKSHHNVGGLPARMKLQLLEPLRELFKDEVRAVGAALGLPREVVWRQPFPGPGLGVRVIGEITAERLRVLRDADAIIQDEMMKSGWYWKVWQSFAVYLPVKSVGVIGDERNYADVIAIRVVESKDAMTADWSRLPMSFSKSCHRALRTRFEGCLEWFWISVRNRPRPSNGNSEPFLSKPLWCFPQSQSAWRRFFKGVTFAALLLAGGDSLCVGGGHGCGDRESPPLPRTEEALEQVRSVRFIGTLLTDTQQSVSIEIIFQKPYQQRIVTTGIDRMETTALDDYEGWQKIEDLKDKGRWRMKLLTKDQVKRLRANTWENLAFFRGLQIKGGQVENHGDTTVRGARGAQTELHAHHRQRVHPLL